MPLKRLILDKATRLYKVPPGITAFAAEPREYKLIPRRELIDLATLRWPIPFNQELLPDLDAMRPASREEIRELKDEIAAWLEKTHGLRLSPRKEVLLGGSISSMMHAMTMAFIETGDLVYVPELSAPLYRRTAIMAGGELVTYPVRERFNWQPDFSGLNSRVSRVARMLIVNSPHNPAGAVVDERTFEDLVTLASRENLILINDASFQQLSEPSAGSILAVKDADKVAVELYSFSYTFGLPYIPFGFACGNRDVLAGMQAAGQLGNDFLPSYYIHLARVALAGKFAGNMKTLRQSLRNTATAAAPLLSLLGLKSVGQATVPFLWSRLERRRNSVVAARMLYRRSRTVVSPGTSFGDSGQGYLRFSLTASPEDFAAAEQRVRKSGLRLFSRSEQ